MMAAEHNDDEPTPWMKLSRALQSKGDLKVANSQAEVTEIRFVVEPELLQVYVHMNAFGDSPIGVQGWHHKTFPATVPAIEVLERWAKGAQEDDPLMWSLEAP